jgi:hypothetical protein
MHQTSVEKRLPLRGGGRAIGIAGMHSIYIRRGLARCAFGWFVPRNGHLALVH